MDLKLPLHGIAFWRTIRKKSTLASPTAFFLFTSFGFILDTRNTSSDAKRTLS